LSLKEERLRQFGNLFRQQAVSLVLEVEQYVVVGFGAHNDLIGGWEVVVSFAVQSLLKLVQMFRRREELGGGLSFRLSDAGKDHDPARMFG